MLGAIWWLRNGYNNINKPAAELDLSFTNLTLVPQLIEQLSSVFDHLKSNSRFGIPVAVIGAPISNILSFGNRKCIK